MTDKAPSTVRPSFSMKGGIGSVATYMGRRPPEEVKLALESLAEVQKPIFRKVLQFVVNYIKGTEITEEMWTKFSDSLPEVPPENLRLLFSGLHTVMKTAIRLNLDITAFKVDLQNLQVPGEFIQDLAAAFQKTKGDIIVADPDKHVAFPTLDSIDWRVDVTISTSDMTRILKPSVLMRMVDSEGNIRTFEVNSDAFNKLRYSVARVLKEFDTLEKLPILKIDRNVIPQQ